MSTGRGRTEILVGLFLLLGLGCIGAMVLTFGRTSSSLQKMYRLTVEFPNASGLIKGTDVLLSGARIGQVASTPVLLKGSFLVEVQLELQEEVPIPRGSKFLVGSSGLLGDRFVDVHLVPGYNAAETYQPGERIAGAPAGGGLDDLTNKGGAVMDQISAELISIQQMTQRLNEGLLHERNLKNIEETFGNLRLATEKFKETAAGLEGLLQKAGATMEAAGGTMKTADAAAADLRVVAGELRKTIEAATKTLETTSGLVRRAADGGGPLSTLINDKKMAEDLRVFAGNLRRSGVLFYRNRPLEEPTAPATPAPRGRR